MVWTVNLPLKWVIPDLDATHEVTLWGLLKHGKVGGIGRIYTDIDIMELPLAAMENFPHLNLDMTKHVDFFSSQRPGLWFNIKM